MPAIGENVGVGTVGNIGVQEAVTVLMAVILNEPDEPLKPEADPVPLRLHAEYPVVGETEQETGVPLASAGFVEQLDPDMVPPVGCVTVRPKVVTPVTSG